MSSYNKIKGTKFESDVLKYLRKLGHFAERLALAGAEDQGDLVCIIAGQTYIFECKNHKKMDLPRFWKEAEKEAKNYAKARGLPGSPPAFVIAKRRNAGVEKAWVVQPLEEWIKLQMPTPQGDITSTEIIKPKEEPKEEEQK